MIKHTQIKRKPCKCGCGKMPTIGCKGFNYNCLSEEEKQKKGDKRKLQMKASSARKLASNKLRIDAHNEDNKLELWFKARRNEMEGVCIQCGESTNRNDDKYYRWSICHIVPKSLIKSCATHPDNWIELCQQHHNEFDSTFEKASKMNCFDEIKMKFQLFKNIIPPEELRKINPQLLS